MKTELEYIHSDKNVKIWIIELKNTNIIVKFGKKNTNLQTKEIIFTNLNEAEYEYKKRIDEKIKKGYETIEKKSNIEIINPILENLTDFAIICSEYQNKLYNQVNEELFENKMLTFYNKNLTKFQNEDIKNQNKTPLPFMKSGIIEKTINKNLKNELLELINNFADKTKIDYHPNTDEKVLDIIHPSIYPLILDEKLSNKILDFWKRPYESSKFQWLPSEFKIDSNGKCKIESYINNLPLTETKLYESIEKTFELVLPEFEKIWSYTNALELYNDTNKNDDGIYKHISLKGKNLQVITKIVRIKLKPEEELLGAWHVEGMSHENIVATSSITLDQDKDFDADLLFKRIYSSAEANYLSECVPQHPFSKVNNFLNNYYVPLGKIKIKNSSMILFPNSHIHRVDMKNNGTKEETRTLLVFWLVNPNINIKSTKDIVQQNYDINKAYENRLELMKERTFYKQTFNQRDLNLCEH